MSCIVLGCDQAEDNKAGFAVLNLELAPPDQILYTYLEEYKYKDDKGKTHNIPKSSKRTRCIRFALTLQRIITEYHPDVLCTEIVRAFHHGVTNTDTVAALSRIEAVMFLIAKRIPIYEFGTSSWQALILKPKRNDDRKALSVALVKSLYNKDLSEHECDAIWIGIAYPHLKDNPNTNITEIL